MFATKPLQTLTTNYGIHDFRSSGVNFGDTFIYENSRAPNTSGKKASYLTLVRASHLSTPEYSAFFLGRAETRGDGYEPYTIYAGTNSDLLTVTNINQTSTEAQLAGCANTSFVPFTWNYSLPSPTLEQLDSAGGKTAFIIIPNITAQEPFGTEYVDTQWGMGLVYSYTAPGEIENPTR